MILKLIHNSIYSFFVIFTFLFTPFTASCQIFSKPNEADALANLRRMTKDGKLPDEYTVQQIANNYPNTKTAALAKIVQARIKLSNGDGFGAANLLDSTIYKQKTSLGDYVFWLRGSSLAKAGKYPESIQVFDQFLREYPTSIRLRSVAIERARSLKQTNQTAQVVTALQPYVDKKEADALLLLAQTYEQAQDQPKAIEAYRRLYFYSPSSPEGKEAEASLTRLGVILPIVPLNADEAIGRAENFLKAKNFAEAEKAYTTAFSSFPTVNTPANNLKRLTVYSSLRKMSEAQTIFNSIPNNATEKPEAFATLARGYANARMWLQAKDVLNQMRSQLSNNSLTAKTWVDVGLIAREAKNKADELFLLRTAISAFANQIDVAKVQFELAWSEHDSKNFAVSSQMFTEHLAKYAAKDTTYRGRAGYWAARDSQQAGKINEACALYEAMLARYDANWYGYLSSQRLTALKNQGQCKNIPNTQLINDAVKSLKTVTVYPETATAKEQERLVRADDLSIIGMFDWSIDELNEATKTAPNSPKVNFTLANLYRRKEDNASALLALARSYPDYSQMKPEEMSKEEWSVFYPLHSWDLIKLWAANRSLDPYQVAGLIRQESVFHTRAKSGANAYGLMQLLLPTAKATARKYGTTVPSSAEELYNPALNIELGTAYMKDQLTKYGRIEYLGVAYNAGPGRVTQWQNSIPASEMDEWVEQIPFKETKGYVQGITRNRLQYARLYDLNGNFKANVGTRPLRGEIETKSREQMAQDFPEVILPEGNAEKADE